MNSKTPWENAAESEGTLQWTRGGSQSAAPAKSGTPATTTGNPVFGYYRTSRALESLMPWITVQLLAGRTVEQKKELVAALTRETSRICGCGTDAVQIVIEDVQKDNWGVGGVLASEKFPGPPSSLGSGDPRYRKQS